MFSISRYYIILYNYVCHVSHVDSCSLVSEMDVLINSALVSHACIHTCVYIHTFFKGLYCNRCSSIPYTSPHLTKVTLAQFLVELECFTVNLPFISARVRYIYNIITMYPVVVQHNKIRACIQYYAFGRACECTYL